MYASQVFTWQTAATPAIPYCVVCQYHEYISNYYITANLSTLNNDQNEQNQTQPLRWSLYTMVMFSFATPERCKISPEISLKIKLPF